jgi:hypothetical protein
MVEEVNVWLILPRCNRRARVTGLRASRHPKNSGVKRLVALQLSSQNFPAVIVFRLLALAPFFLPQSTEKILTVL